MDHRRCGRAGRRPGRRPIEPRRRQVARTDFQRHLRRLPSQPARTQADQSGLLAGTLYHRGREAATMAAYLASVGVIRVRSSSAGRRRSVPSRQHQLRPRLRSAPRRRSRPAQGPSRQNPSQGNPRHRWRCRRRRHLTERRRPASRPNRRQRRRRPPMLSDPGAPRIASTPAICRRRARREAMPTSPRNRLPLRRRGSSTRLSNSRNKGAAFSSVPVPTFVNPRSLFLLRLCVSFRRFGRGLAAAARFRHLRLEEGFRGRRDLRRLLLDFIADDGDVLAAGDPCRLVGVARDS